MTTTQEIAGVTFTATKAHGKNTEAWQSNDGRWLLTVRPGAVGLVDYHDHTPKGVTHHKTVEDAAQVIK